MHRPGHEWGIWVMWRAQPRWTIADGAGRIAESLRLLHAAIPEHTAAFKIGPGRRPGHAVDDPELAEQLAPALRASRNTNLFAASEPLGDASILLFPIERAGFHVTFQQVVTGAGWHEGFFQIQFDASAGHLLAERAAGLPDLIARLGQLWQADNAWLDFVHVRQEWNRWTYERPVFSWASWLSHDYAIVDIGGLDLTVVELGGGVLITLNVEPAMMADPEADAGRHLVEELARRSIRR